jgi:CheY-like chemotaxis protein
MESGGALTIETGNEFLDAAYAEAHAEVMPGPYVMVAVSDTGTGMPPEVIEKAFEPFFTTKPVGKGTGLGLSMVYGFIKQSGGHVKIYSEIGHGTTIKLYLPAEKGAVNSMPLDRLDTSAPKFAVSGEVVLLVEDDPGVQQVGAAILEYLGYEVVRVNDGAAALEVLERGGRIDLLFTDIIMRGGMSGIDLAQRVRRKWPDLKVLLCSGYAENAFVRRDALEPGTAFISKPYDRIKLAAILRKVLGDNSPVRRAV